MNLKGIPLGGINARGAWMGVAVVTPPLSDTVDRGGVETPIHATFPCRYLGERTDKRAKKECKTESVYLPVYRCPTHRLCSPFGHVTDSDLIMGCGNCPDYARRKKPTQSGNSLSK